MILNESLFRQERDYQLTIICEKHKFLVLLNQSSRYIRQMKNSCDHKARLPQPANRHSANPAKLKISYEEEEL
jgi:hypothetical protein